ncbi:plasmid partitioning protein RepB [Sinorhizobium meliloti]|uniref:plasmid partitioning protein RepB n=1 Tax=Rhizobium meliloti TaxID=382 RepID=UPI00041FCACD|nr:plasmid partitioning protein RepB [Sinorhizobium meliloti]TWA89097.1 ParB family chromosome partitioning protein [Ensifer sp. SEMIA 134]TWB25169.1 ParB family chromosome partitioning protein [Ensifer sp. SEMIA 135]MCM5693075.1 plasmid partitioning protein RepB [Sinorhizobium meliloti]MDE4615982.1 plasmid partitioning protein RepB [Sinorhizobium meliloti]RVL27236.1 plasmid partitioning protein RepB [Sinorhizobium meliloti]
MARKNPFANVMGDDAPDTSKAVLDYTIKGASKSLMNSFDEMAAKADRLLEGEAVVELDPGIIDESFVRDRLEDNQEDFNDLLSAIRDRGQDTPILVRPHPSATGRYMVVFGHRRLRASKMLEKKVRAVVKDLKDSDHLVAQGQENSARANLSFIERAMFAGEISRRQFDGDNSIVLSALSVDRATLSKMLAVAAMPKEVIAAIGAAKGIGRDRWYDLKNLLERPSNLEKAMAFIGSDEFKSKVGDERFNALVAHVKTIGRNVPKSPKTQKWVSEDKSVSAEMKNGGKTYTFALKAKGAAGFGDFIAESLGDLYQAYQSRKDQQGE